MSVITYLDVRNEVVRQIKEAFGNTEISIEAYPGKIDEQALKNFPLLTPSILTSLIGITDEGENNSYCEFVTYILYRKDVQEASSDRNLKIVSALVPVIRNLDTDWAYDVKDIKAENLFSSSSSEASITLWAISYKWFMRGAILDSTGSEIAGGILLSSNLEYFESTESALKIGSQIINDQTYMEVNI